MKKSNISAAQRSITKMSLKYLLYVCGLQESPKTHTNIYIYMLTYTKQLCLARTVTITYILRRTRFRGDANIQLFR